MKRFGVPLEPSEVRRILTETGKAQTGDQSQHIGPLVNLKAAISALPSTSSPTAKPTGTKSNKSSKFPKAVKPPTLSSVDPSPAPTPGAKSNKSDKESLSSLADHLTLTPASVTESGGYEWTNEDEFSFSMAMSPKFQVHRKRIRQHAKQKLDVEGANVIPFNLPEAS